jgi:hypothetical protein
VSDVGPKIEVSSYLDFGSIRLGEVKELPLEISNTGDTPTEVILETNRGWFSVSLSQFLLEPTEKKTVSIRFAPSISGRALADLTVTSTGAVQLVRLAADIPTWIEVRPQTLTISPNQNQNREAALVLRNPNPEEETVQIDSKNALLHQTSVVLPPAESVEVKFSVPSIQKQALKGLITISNAKEFSIVVPWSAKVVPASLKTETRISPDLSILPSLVRISNNGGISGSRFPRLFPSKTSLVRPSCCNQTIPERSESPERQCEKRMRLEARRLLQAAFGYPVLTVRVKSGLRI